jgi:hypothetical protein
VNATRTTDACIMSLTDLQLTEELITMSMPLPALCPMAAVAGPPALRACPHLQQWPRWQGRGLPYRGPSCLLQSLIIMRIVKRSTRAWPAQGGLMCWGHIA